MAGVLFQRFPDAAAYAKRKARELGVSVRLCRDGSSWAVDVTELREASSAPQEPVKKISQAGAKVETQPLQSEQFNLYKISTESLRKVIASKFGGLSKNQIIIIYNQMDRHSLTSEERQLLENKYESIKQVKSWSPSSAFVVYSATDGQD